MKGGGDGVLLFSSASTPLNAENVVESLIHVGGEHARSSKMTLKENGFKKKRTTISRI